MYWYWCWIPSWKSLRVFSFRGSLGPAPDLLLGESSCSHSHSLLHPSNNTNPNFNPIRAPHLTRPHYSKGFSVLYFNCRSVLPKHDELIALCKTWLNTEVLDNEVAIPNYSLIRPDHNRHGGGVAIYVHSSILFNVLLSDPAGLELIFVSLVKCNFKLCSCVFYSPPSSCINIFNSLCEAP